MRGIFYTPRAGAWIATALYQVTKHLFKTKNYGWSSLRLNYPCFVHLEQSWVTTLRSYGGALYGSASHILRSLEHLCESKKKCMGELFTAQLPMCRRKMRLLSVQRLLLDGLSFCVCYDASVALGQQKKYIVLQFGNEAACPTYGLPSFLDNWCCCSTGQYWTRSKLENECKCPMAQWIAPRNVCTHKCICDIFRRLDKCRGHNLLNVQF